MKKTIVPHNNGKWVAPRYTVTKLLMDVTFARIFLTLIFPFRQLVTWQLLCGRSLWQSAKNIERLIMRVIGFLSLPPRALILRSLGLGLVDIRRWHLIGAALVAYSALLSIVKRRKDSKNEYLQQRRALFAKMALSKSYYEWSVYAAKLDALDGIDQIARWRQETKMYDRKLLEEKVAHLRRVRFSGNGMAEQMFAVRADLMRNLGNITNSALHEHFPVVPEPIREYIEEVRTHLDQITHSTDLPLNERSAFLKETRHAYGRTALLLSGGGALGAFHLGVVRALLEHGMLPRVLAGSSVGALVCALVGTRNDPELHDLMNNLHALDLTFFSNSSIPEVLSNLVSTGSSRDSDVLLNRLRHMLGDLTFSEAYAHTGRVLNVAVTAAGSTQEPTRLLNYLTAPHVIVWSAVACSSAFPGLKKPMDLMARNAQGDVVRFSADAVGAGEGERRWRDGSLEEDLPMKGLSEMFSVNYFMVSQTNPHIVPFLNLKRQMGTAGQLAEAEFKHRCRQLMEVLPDWMPGHWLKGFSQPWEGDITIVLPETLLQLRRAIINPTQEDLLQAVRQGEVCTWGKMSAIQCNCGIEVTLDACIQKVTSWERQERNKVMGGSMPMKSRIPSWINMAGYNNSNNSSDDLMLSDGEDVWEAAAENHLPLPEERPSSRQSLAVVASPYIGYECTDASVDWFNNRGKMAEKVKSADFNNLDVIAP